MLRLLGLALLAGAFVLWRRNAEAAVSLPDIPSSDPTMPDSAPVVTGKAAYLAMVQQINQQQYGGWFDPAIVMGVMQAESNFNPLAYRAEPQIGDASYGLMQTLYSTAIDRGYSGPPDGLYDPYTSISLGMAHLKWSYDYLAARGAPPSLQQWLSSYNAGVGYVAKGGMRHAYVAKVLGYADGWRA